MCKYYKTDLLGLYAAEFPTVVASTTASVKELLNNPALDGKPTLKLAQLRDPDFMIRGDPRDFNLSSLFKLFSCSLNRIVFDRGTVLGENKNRT